MEVVVKKVEGKPGGNASPQRRRVRIGSQRNSKCYAAIKKRDSCRMKVLKKSGGDARGKMHYRRGAEVQGFAEK